MGKTVKSKKLQSENWVFKTALLTILIVLTSAITLFFYDHLHDTARAQTTPTTSPSAILACSNSTNGILRIVDSLEKCKTSEKGIALQSAISNLVSDIEVVWYQPPGDRHTNFEGGIDLTCPDGKVVIGGGNTEVVRKNAPKHEAIVGTSGRTTNAVSTWSVTPWRYEQAPIVYAVCARVNK